MSGINSGILQNAYPLSATQIKEVEKDVILNNKCIAYLDENNNICFAKPTDPEGIKKFAWHAAHRLLEQDGSFIKIVYTKTGLDTFILSDTFRKNDINSSWIYYQTGDTATISDGVAEFTNVGYLENGRRRKLHEGAIIEVVINGDVITCPLEGVTISEAYTTIGSYNGFDIQIGDWKLNRQTALYMPSVLVPDNTTSVTYKYPVANPPALTAGLYQTGAIALYNEQGAEAIEGMLITPWEDLVASGAIVVDNGEVSSYKNPHVKDMVDPFFGDLIFPNDGSVTSVATEGFRELDNLTGVYLPNVTNINDYAFIYCYALTTAIMPLVTSIGSHAFGHCKNLMDVNLPSAINIYDEAFFSCDALVSVNAPKAIYIGMDSFNGCLNLIDVNLPCAQTIRGGVFADCPNLTRIDLPNAVVIKANAFKDSLNVNAIILRTTETVCEIDITSFVLAWNGDVPKTINDNFYIPASMYEAYRSVYAPAFEQAGFAGMFEVVFHKIEDLPDEDVELTILDEAILENTVLD